MRDDTNNNRFVEAALQYARLGYGVFPCAPRQKKPLTEHGCKDATTDEATIRQWWQRWPNANIGIACNGVFVVDVDPVDGGENSWLDTELGSSLRFAGGPVAVTPRGGRHFWFRAPDGVMLKPGTSQIAPKVDHRTTGGSYVVVAPSVFANGEYRWETPLDCEARKLPPAPEEIVRQLSQPKTQQHKPARHAAGKKECHVVGEGSRNDFLTREAGRLRRFGCDNHVLNEALRSINRERCAPPLDDEEVQRIAESIGRYPTGQCGVDLPATLDDWPDPQPLPDDLPSVMPFDLDLLPNVFRPLIEDISERMQCPPDYPAVAAMVALSGIVGRKIGIRPKRQDDWLVVPNLWGVVIGRPSLMKTPAIQEPLKRIRRLEVEAQKVFESAEREFIATKAVAEAKAKVTKQGISDAVKEGKDALKIAMELVQDVTAEPTRRRYLTNDTTVEKLGDLLNKNPNGLIIFRDELSGWLRSLDKDGQEGARSFYLEAWNGNGRYTFDRIGRGTLDIEAAVVSIIGAIQPGPLQAYLRDAVRGGGGDDGLLQRFQLAVWPDFSAEWRNVDRWPDSKARDAAWEVFQRIDQQTAEDFGAQRDEFDSSEIPFLRFSPLTAQDRFDQWRSDFERRLRSGQEHPAIEAHLAKYRKLVPALALLIHLADTRGGLIGDESLDKAIRWATYLESHARRMYGAAIKPDVSAAKMLAVRIQKKELTDGFALRDIYRNGWTGLGTKEDAERAANLLVDYDWLAVRDVPSVTRHRRQYFINPKVLCAS